MITKLSLKNFAAFKELEIDFSSRINVIIGGNGTGKTILLKAAYALCSGALSLRNISKSTKGEIRDAITSKLARVFLPMEGKIGRMRRYGSSDKAKLEAVFSSDEKLSISFHSNSKSVAIDENIDYGRYNYSPVFIPTKEVLSILAGVSSEKSDKETIHSLFDDTCLDLCNQIRNPAEPISTEKIDLDPRFGSVFPDIANAIGGRFEFDNQSYFFQQGRYEERRVKGQHQYGDRAETVFKPLKGSKISNSMTAEGFRKIGILQQLLANGSLNPGSSSALFWDEPEANMNPNLMKMIVDILLLLSRNNQQVILSTHDYFLLKWFDILADSGKDDHVSFHALYHDPESQEIQIESTDNYREISPNSIAETFGNLTDREISKTMKELGR